MVLTRSRRRLQEHEKFLAEKAKKDDRRRRIWIARLRQSGLLKPRRAVPRIRPKSFINKSGFRTFTYKSMTEEFYHRVVNAPHQDNSRYGKDPAICYSTVGPARPLYARPLGRLPSHIIEALNDHYAQITNGVMNPNGDLYNNEDMPLEPVSTAVMNENEFNELLKGNDQYDDIWKKKKRNRAIRAVPSTSAVPPTPRPYCDQNMTHGEVIGKFVVQGSGQFTRAVCSRTREVFTAHVLPKWKAVKIIEVIKRLQIPLGEVTSDDEIRMSEICVSKRTEIVKNGDRFIIFNPIEANTIHSYCADRMDSMTEKEAIAIFKRIVEIVRFCHSRNVLFRNYKTRNFYLLKKEDGDFEIRPCFIQDMCCEDDDTDAQYTRRSVCVPFMAPEMLSHGTKPLHCRTTEVWGLGVLMYILLVGKYPFHEVTMPKLFRAIKVKPHRWPINFISEKSRTMVDLLLKKVDTERMPLDKLWEELHDDFPDVRCRSNFLWLQQDIIVKVDLFKMYWESYKDRLLPQNVIPIREEYEACQKDVPIATALAVRDLEEVKASIRRHVQETECDWRDLVIDARLSQINQMSLLHARETAEKRNTAMRYPRIIRKKDVSLELLLPSDLYPPSLKYHPSHKRMDWHCYKLLRIYDQLRFPELMRGQQKVAYPEPVYQGRRIALAKRKKQAERTHCTTA